MVVRPVVHAIRWPRRTRRASLPHGYWYPQVAVYDDVNGWVADPYMLEAEFYMDPADYDVRVTMPRGWVVGATGTLLNAEEILNARRADAPRAGARDGTRGRHQQAGRCATRHSRRWRRRSRGTSPRPTCATSRGARAIATRGMQRVRSSETIAARTDTVDIHSFYRLEGRAAAWAVGRRTLHARCHRAALRVSVGVSVADDDIDGGRAHERRDGISATHVHAALGGHALARRRSDARDRAHVVPDAGWIERDALPLDG